MPGDLHKLWRTRDPKGYHVEYGYSCMGYEIAGGLGVKMAAPDREVIVMVGDGSYLMMAQELVTAVAEGFKLTVVLVQNHGYQSIGALSESVGSQRFGTRYRYRGTDDARSRSTSPPTPRASAPTSCASRPIDELEAALRRRAPRRVARPSCTSRPTRSWARRAPRRGGTCPSPRSSELDTHARRARPTYERDKAHPADAT